MFSAASSYATTGTEKEENGRAKKAKMRTLTTLRCATVARYASVAHLKVVKVRIKARITQLRTLEYACICMIFSNNFEISGSNEIGR